MQIAKLVSDTTLHALCGPPTEQNPMELASMVELYSRRQPKQVLEIGVRHGGTLFHWIKMAVPRTKIVAVDWQFSEEDRDLFSTWKEDKDIDLVLVEGDSQAETTRLAVAGEGSYDWVFIDAGHDYPHVKHDWETYGCLVKSGGCVLLHDITESPTRNADIDVCKLWHEITHSGAVTQTLLVDPSAPAYGIGIVYFN